MVDFHLGGSVLIPVPKASNWPQEDLGMVEKQSGSRGRKLLEKAGRGIYVNVRRRRKKMGPHEPNLTTYPTKNTIPVEQCTKKGFFSPHKCVTSLHNP